MKETYSFLRWYYHSVSGTILEIMFFDGSEFYFHQEAMVCGPFDSFFSNKKIIEFHREGIFFQYHVGSKNWFAVSPKHSLILKKEKEEEIDELLYISEQIFDTHPCC